jgi:hypothetical protein
LSSVKQAHIRHSQWGKGLSTQHQKLKIKMLPKK